MHNSCISMHRSNGTYDDCIKVIYEFYGREPFRLVVCERLCFASKSVLEEDPEAHPEEGDGHGANDRAELQNIRAKKAAAHDSRESSAKQPHERIIHERSSTGYYDKAVDLLEGDRISLLEGPVLVPEETVGRCQQYRNRVISKCFPGIRCWIQPQQQV